MTAEPLRKLVKSFNSIFTSCGEVAAKKAVKSIIAKR
jgi:hypothetical protein